LYKVLIVFDRELKVTRSWSKAIMFLDCLRIEI